jgi:hypothetical protein
MPPLTLIPSKAWWAIGGAAACAVAWFAHEWAAGRAKDEAVNAALQSVQAAAKEELLKAKAEVVAAQTDAAMARWENDREAMERNRVLEADVVRLRDADLSLRRTIAALSRREGGGSEGAPAVGILDAAPALASALGQCSSRYAGVAEVADRLSSQVTELQGYIRNVVGPLCISGYESRAPVQPAESP